MKRSTATFLLLLKLTEALVVYKSTLSINQIGIPSGLHYIPNNGQIMSQSNSFTVCCRFNYQRLLNRPRILDIVNPNHPSQSFLEINAGYPYSWWRLGNYEKGNESFSNWIVKDPVTNGFSVWTANLWHHLCVAYSKDESKVMLVKDGKVYKNDIDPRLKNVEVPSKVLESIYFGRCKDNGCSDHVGSVTDFNLWDFAYSVDQMVKWTTCGIKTQGNVIDWQTATWKVENMDELVVEYEKICLPDKLGLTLFPNKVNFSSAMELCRSVQGSLVHIENVVTETKVKNILKTRTSCANESWIDLWDQWSEGIFNSAENPTLILSNISYQNWDLGEPNGDTVENCVAYKRGVWNDYSCGDQQLCSVCDIQSIPIFTMRGLCYGSSFDHHYSWTGNDSGSDLYAFRGFSKSYLSYEGNQWILSLYTDGEIYASTNETNGQMYPFGTYNWYFFNDTCPRAGPSETVAENTFRMPISFSACTDDQFTCRDGTCVDLLHVCNGQLDCLDKSDEVNCQLIRFDPSYLQSVPPVGINSDHLPINMRVTIESILDINQVGSTMQLQFQMVLTWTDSRLEFRNVKPGLNSNVISEDQRGQLWLPTVAFPNTKEKLKATFNDNNSSATVMLVKEGIRGVASPLNILTNERIFDGRQAALTVSKYLLIDFICSFSMAKYPFDEQVCEAKMAPVQEEKDLILFQLKHLEYKGLEDINEYIFRNLTFVVNEDGEIVLMVHFGRREMDVMLRTILPTILITLVTFSTNIYNKNHFDAIATVNLTSLLVMVTLYISISENLPATSYMKMIDVWLIFSLFMPFLEVTMHAVLDHLRGKLEHCQENYSTSVRDNVTIKIAFDEDKSRTIGHYKKLMLIIDLSMTYALPSLYFLFMIGFFLAGKLLP